MQSVLIVVHLMIVIALVAVVLLQRSEGGALGIGSPNGFMTGRGQANALTRATAILAALFFATSIGLTLMSRLNQGPEVTFQDFKPVEPGKDKAKEGADKGTLLDQLQKMDDQSGKPALPTGLGLPGQAGNPQPGQSVLETKPATQEGQLPLPALPAAPQAPTVPTSKALPVAPPSSPVQTAPPSPLSQ